jgi:hypothetical protein
MDDLDDFVEFDFAMGVDVVKCPYYVENRDSDHFLK